jgi:charged multivesicular body protein 4A/B
MSFMQRFLGFGSKKNGQPANLSSAEAIKNLCDVEEMLGKRQVLLESQIDEEKQKAVALSKQGNKRAAIGAMKRMKRYEKTLAQIDGTLTTLEMQRESLHDAASNVEVFRVMRTATNALKKSNAHLDPVEGGSR